MTTQIEFDDFESLKAALIKSPAWPPARIAALETAINARRAAFPIIKESCKIGTTTEHINGPVGIVLAHSTTGGMIDMMTARDGSDKARSDYV